MAETDDDAIAFWRDKVTTLRKRGRVSGAALSVVPASEIDVRQGRPQAPERLSAEERELWDKLVSSRRPQWFSGGEELLEAYVSTVVQVQQLEAALRRTKPGVGERYQKLARLHRQAAMLAGSLATKLRLAPLSKLDKCQPIHGDLPVG